MAKAQPSADDILLFGFAIFSHRPVSHDFITVGNDEGTTKLRCRRADVLSTDNRQSIDAARFQSSLFLASSTTRHAPQIFYRSLPK